MTPAELSHTVLCAVRRAVDAGELDAAAAEPGAGRIVVERPRPGGYGDYATNVALQLSRSAGRPPRQVAEVLKGYLGESDGIAGVSVTGPGFLNLRLRDSAAPALVARILRSGLRYGFADEPGTPYRPAAPGDHDHPAHAGHPARPQHPPVHLHAPQELRALVVMDAAARILRSQGALVRTSCDAPPLPEWTQVLGVEVDTVTNPASDAPAPDAPAQGTQAPGTPVPGTLIRPTPAPTTSPDTLGPPTPTPTLPLALGRDAARWALLHPAPHDPPHLGGALVQRDSNPLFRVQYAHARTHALRRNAADLGFAAEPGGVSGQEELLAVLADHPRVLRRAAHHRGPDRLARHLVEVAGLFLARLDATVLPQGEEKPSAAHRARLALAEATGTVLAGGLSLLGIDAPAHL
ncbi:ArgS-related anticodon-binding protein NrtL [Streptomyces sp. NPDC049813]|uniref:ArgS-related anticodon-binding protein NrtL n=1 Tax=Streptomyces sp. NPDC049813 TaxID=3365597 RepID=UPI00378FE4B5